MKLPSKIVTYNESLLPKMAVILSVLNRQEIPANLLYKKVRSKVNDIGEFLEAMDCLYALGKIEIDTQKGVIRYVA